MNFVKKLSSISKNEWITTRWGEVTMFSDSERMFIPTGTRTPSEAYQAAYEYEYLEKILGKDWYSFLREEYE